MSRYWQSTIVASRAPRRYDDRELIVHAVVDVLVHETSMAALFLLVSCLLASLFYLLLVFLVLVLVASSSSTISYYLCTSTPNHYH